MLSRSREDDAVQQCVKVNPGPGDVINGVFHKGEYAHGKEGPVPVEIGDRVYVSPAPHRHAVIFLIYTAPAHITHETHSHAVVAAQPHRTGNVVVIAEAHPLGHALAVLSQREVEGCPACREVRPVPCEAPALDEADHLGSYAAAAVQLLERGKAFPADVQHREPIRPVEFGLVGIAFEHHPASLVLGALTTEESVVVSAPAAIHRLGDALELPALRNVFG